MRAFLILLLAAGCYSPDGRRYDYLSVNRASFDFLKETHADEQRWTPRYLAEDLQFGKRERDNRRQRRMGVAFAVDSLFGDEISRFNDMWVDLMEEFRWDAKKIRHSALFGHLDTGDP